MRSKVAVSVDVKIDDLCFHPDDEAARAQPAEGAIAEELARRVTRGVLPVVHVGTCPEEGTRMIVLSGRSFVEAQRKLGATHVYVQCFAYSSRQSLDEAHALLGVSGTADEWSRSLDAYRPIELERPAARRRQATGGHGAHAGVEVPSGPEGSTARGEAVAIVATLLREGATKTRQRHDLARHALELDASNPGTTDVARALAKPGAKVETVWRRFCRAAPPRAPEEDLLSPGSTAASIAESPRRDPSLQAVEEVRSSAMLIDAYVLREIAASDPALAEVVRGEIEPPGYGAVLQAKLVLFANAEPISRRLINRIRRAATLLEILEVDAATDDDPPDEMHAADSASMVACLSEHVVSVLVRRGWDPAALGPVLGIETRQLRAVVEGRASLSPNELWRAIDWAARSVSRLELEPTTFVRVISATRT